MIVRAIIRTVWITFDVLLCIPLYIVLLIFASWLRLIWSYAFWEFESWLFRELNHIVGYWIWSAERTMVNYQSMADVPTLCATLCKKGASGGKIAWVWDVMFRWTLFGLVNQMHGDYFNQEGQRGMLVDSLADNLKSAYLPRGRRCLNTSLLWNDPFKEGLPEGALPCCVPRLRIHPNGFRYLVDVTIGYQNGSALSVWALLFAHHAPCEVGLHYRVIRAEDVPHNTDEEMRDFLFDLWREKDRKLAHYNRFGHFPNIPREEGTVVDFHLTGMISRHLMFMVIVYFVYGYLIVLIYRNILTLLFR